ncbi:MAG: molybdenum cofactor biosynthesis protein MoaE [Chloroflexi bacterium]|nr:molybdenum cofactor biosynthesis protein MoaE [Chloroflexota bacterium]
MKINVLFFATLKDRAQTHKAEMMLADSATVADLKAELGNRFPALIPALPTALVSRNHEFAFAEDKLAEGDEVALFPPVSGGADNADNPAPQLPTFFRVTNDALDLDALVAGITLSSTGAACVFTGMVRGITRRGEAHQTSYLEYESYVPMAEAKMKQVADEIRGRWPAVEGIAIVQRIGRLDPGTPTVLIACSAAHRDTGVFEAARYGIDRLKEIVPVWKKEVGPGGEEWVEGEYTPGKDD